MHIAILERTSWAPRVPPFSKQPTTQERPKQPPRGHREGADKEGALAAMKALWRELADPKIKEHHGPSQRPHGWPRSKAAKAGCRLVSRRSDQGQTAPALAPVFNQGTPGFWGQRPPTYCVADGQVMIEAGRALAGLKGASTAPAHVSTTPLPKVDDNHLMNIVVGVR
jgi:hypothetical protein